MFESTLDTFYIVNSYQVFKSKTFFFGAYQTLYLETYIHSYEYFSKICSTHR
jgi:hypothetical protein